MKLSIKCSLEYLAYFSSPNGNYQSEKINVMQLIRNGRTTYNFSSLVLLLLPHGATIYEINK